MRQEMMGFGDASFNVYRPDALPAAQPTVSKHRRLSIVR